MRLIDADVLKEMKFSGGMHDDNWIVYVPFREVVENIDKAPAVGGWISVKDRLPDKSGKYLVTVTSNVDYKPFVKTAWFLLKLWDNWQFKYECEPNVPGFYNGDGEGDWVERMVTHWMPLPEPPEESA